MTIPISTLMQSEALIAQYLSTSDTTYLRQAFALLDEDSDGILNLTELQNCLVLWVEDCELRTLTEKLLTDFDIDQDGGLNEEEFIHMIPSLRGGPLHEWHSSDYTLNIPDFSNGRFDLTELFDTYLESGSQRMLEMIFVSIDTDKDGAISKQEVAASIGDWEWEFEDDETEVWKTETPGFLTLAEFQRLMRFLRLQTHGCIAR